MLRRRSAPAGPTKYAATMAPIVPSADRPNSAAMVRSARLAARGSVSVRRSRCGGQAGVLEPLRQVVLLGGQTDLGRLVAHEDFAPIQTAAPIRRPMPAIHAHMPSATGPIEPSVAPPGEPCFWASR